MKKLEEEIQNVNGRWSLRDRAIIGAAGALIATYSISHIQRTLGIEDYTIRMLVDLPFGFAGAYVGLNCDRLTNYFRNRQK